MLSSVSFNFFPSGSFRVLVLALFSMGLCLALSQPADAQLLEGRNKLKTVEEKPKKGFFLFRKKGKSSENAGQVSRRDRKVNIRTTKQPKTRTKQGANYSSTGGGVSIDNAPRSKPRFSDKKGGKKRTKVKSSKKKNKFKRQASLPAIRLHPKIHIYNPASPNPRYSKNPGFDRKSRIAASPRYSSPGPPVKAASVSPKYSQSQGFVTKKGGWVVGFKKTPGILPFAKAGPRYSKDRGIVPPKSIAPRYSKDRGIEPPASVSPRYSQSHGFVVNKKGWVIGFKKTPGLLPIAKAGPRYSKDRGIVSPESISPRYSKDRGIEPPRSISPRYSQRQGFVTKQRGFVVGFKKTPGLFPIAKAGPRYSKDRGIDPPNSVSPRYSQSHGFVTKKSKWVVGFKNTAGFFPIAKAGPRTSKEAGFYRPGAGVGRNSDNQAAQFKLPEKERRDNKFNPLVSTYGLSVKVKPWQKRYEKDINDWITNWQGDYIRVWRIEEKHQKKWLAIQHSGFTGGHQKIKRRKGDIHPSVAYVSGKKINSRKLRKEWRELNIVRVRLQGNKEVAKGVKDGPDKPKYDKKERDIWNY